MKRVLAAIVCSLFLAACGSDTSGGEGNGGDKQKTESAASQNTKAGDEAAENSTAAKDSTGFDSERAKQSYALGMNVAKSLTGMPVEINTNLFVAGIEDALGSGEARLSEAQVRQVVTGLMQQMRAKQQEQRQQTAAANREQAQEFLAKNRDQPGVKTTDSGLQYKVIEQGSGATPALKDVVVVSYVGKLPNGKVFDSADNATFPVKAVIPGWTEALQMMHEGATYKLFVPPKLAYGKAGAGRKIGPNQLLIFKVTLKKIQSADAGGQAKG